MELHERLTALRKKKGLSQLKLAELLDVSRQAISKWESGRSAPSTENLIRLSKIYGVPVDVLVNCELPLPEPELEDTLPEPPPEPPKQGFLKRITKQTWYKVLGELIFIACLVNWGRLTYQAEAFSRFFYPKEANALIQEFDSLEKERDMVCTTGFLLNVSSALYHPESPDIPSEYHATLHGENGFELLFKQEFPESTRITISHSTKRGDARFIVAQGDEVVEEFSLSDLPWQIGLGPGSYRFFLATKRYSGTFDLTLDW